MPPEQLTQLTWGARLRLERVAEGHRVVVSVPESVSNLTQARSIPTLGTRVRVIIEVLDDEDRVIRKLPRLQGRESKRAWARKEDKDSGAEYAVPKTTLTVSGA